MAEWRMSGQLQEREWGSPVNMQHHHPLQEAVHHWDGPSQHSHSWVTAPEDLHAYRSWGTVLGRSFVSMSWVAVSSFGKGVWVSCTWRVTRETSTNNPRSVEGTTGSLLRSQLLLHSSFCCSWKVCHCNLETVHHQGGIRKQWYQCGLCATYSWSQTEVQINVNWCSLPPRISWNLLIFPR